MNNSEILNLQILKNPTKQQVIVLLNNDKNHLLRGFLTEKDLYLWKGSEYIHPQIYADIEILCNVSQQDWLASFKIENNRLITDESDFIDYTKSEILYKIHPQINYLFKDMKLNI